MKIYEVVPRGFCKGVVDAIEIAKSTKEQYPGKKITVLGMLVHNQNVISELSVMGIDVVDDKTKTRLELLDGLNTDVVIMTAHGVGDNVIASAKDKGFIVVDATCIFVKKTHTIIRNSLADGKDIIYLGKKGHPESEGALAISDKIIFIEKLDELYNLPKGDYLITNQTTLSYEDVQATFKVASSLGIEVANEVCDATKTRQEGIKNIPDAVDIVLIVGDKRSNNSNKLAEISSRRFDSHLVDSVANIDES